MAASISNSLIRISSGLQYEDLLVAKGNPHIDQFVKVLRKTTRWAAQWRRVDFDGQFGFGKRVSLTVPRIAELVNGVTLVVQMPDIATAQAAAQAAAGGLWPQGRFLGPAYGWTNSLGHALINTIELEIGGAIVERLDGRLLEVLDELYEPLDTLKAKNTMMKRAPTGFGPTTWVGTPTSPVTVHVPIPFWFSRPGRYSHALPIDAISAEKVRIHVTFRTVEQLYYTDARYDGRTVGFRGGQDVSGAMPELAGGRFWVQNPTAGRVYFMSAAMPFAGLSGEILEGYTMPARLEMEDAYMMLEYVSVEEPEAVALRSAELTYFVEQHNAVQSQASQNTTEVRVELPLTNPTKEILWVLQRPEAEAYNAWFLFTRDLGPYIYQRPNGLNADAFNPCRIPWWPDADLTPTVANDWRVLPAFRDADSEPIRGAAVFYNSYERFEIEGPALFRTLLPTKAATKVAVHNRYVYMWPFGYGQDREDIYQPAGAANWDKIPRKEMYISMAAGRACTQHPNMNVYVWTTNWNVLKVFGGRAGMLFSN